MAITELKASIEIDGLKAVKKDANTAKTAFTSLSDALEMAVLNLMQFQDETLNSGAGLNLLQEGAEDMAGAVDKGTAAVVSLEDVLQRQNQKLQETVSAVEKVSTSMTEMAGDTAKVGSKVTEMANDASRAGENVKEFAADAGKSGDKVKGLGTDSDKTGEKVKGLGGDSEKAGNKLKEFAESAKNAGDKTSEFGGKVKGVGDTMSGVAAAGVGVFAGAVANSVDLDTAVTNMNVALGATGVEAKNNKKLFQDLYNTGISGAEESAVAIQTTKSLFENMDDTAILDMSKKSMALSKTLGVDVADSLRAADALSTKFGISGSEAFDIIQSGFENGLDKHGGDFLDTLTEYSVEYEEAGFSAQEFASMLKKSGDAGVFTMDAAANSIREVNARLAEGSDEVLENLTKIGVNGAEAVANINAGGEPAKATLLEVASKLNAVEDAGQRNAIATALFGTMWEDNGPAIMAQLDGVNGGLEGLEGSASRAVDGVENSLGTRMASLLATLRTTVDNSFGPELWSMFDKLEPTLQSLAEKVGPLFAAIGEKVVEFTPAIVDFIDKFTVWLTNLDPGKIETFLNVFGALFFVVGPILSILGSLITVIGGITSAFGAFGITITAAGVAAAAPFVLVGAAVLALLGTIWYFRDEIWAFLQNLGAGFMNIMSALGASLSEFWGWFTTTMATGFTVVWDAIVSFCSRFVDAIKGLGAGVGEIWNGFLSLMAAGFTGIWDGVVGKVQEIIAKIKEILSKANFKFPHIPMPHFSSTGEFDLSLKDGDGLSLPNIDVDWYAKGGLFNKPSVIGVGEAGTEGVIPLQGPRMGPFAEAIASQMPEQEDNAKADRGYIVNINGNWSIREEMDIRLVARELSKMFQREARMKGI